MMVIAVVFRRRAGARWTDVRDPRGLVVGPDGTRLYVVGTDDTVTVVPAWPRSPTISESIAVNRGPAKVAFTRDGVLGYVTCAGDGTVVPFTAAGGVAGPPVRLPGAAGLGAVAVTDVARTGGP